MQLFNVVDSLLVHIHCDNPNVLLLRHVVLCCGGIGIRGLTLTFYSCHGPISYSFRDRRRFQSKIAKFSHPLYFAPRQKGFPLELGIVARSQQTRMMGLPDRERCLTISSAVWIQYTNVTDGQTDWQTPGDSKDRAYAQRRAVNMFRLVWCHFPLTRVVVLTTVWQCLLATNWIQWRK